MGKRFFKSPAINLAPFFAVTGFVMIGLSAQNNAFAQDQAEVMDQITEANATFLNSVNDLPSASTPGLDVLENFAPEISRAFVFAEQGLAAGDPGSAIDALMVAKGLLNIVEADLPELPESNGSLGNVGSLENGALPMDVLTAEEFELVERTLARMAEGRNLEQFDIASSLARLDQSGFELSALDSLLNDYGLDRGALIESINLDALNFESLATTLSAFDPGQMSELSRQAGQAFQAMGSDLNFVAESVANAISAGVDVDLENMAQGMGFDSFSAAVDAYNAANGTNYNVDTAKEALGAQ